MDAIKLVLGTTDMNWYRVEQEDFYKEDATLEIKITCKFEELNEDERGAFWECLSYEDENKKIPCLYLHWTCRYLSSFNPPRPVVNPAGKGAGADTTDAYTGRNEERRG